MLAKSSTPGYLVRGKVEQDLTYTLGYYMIGWQQDQIKVQSLSSNRVVDFFLKDAQILILLHPWQQSSFTMG